MTYVYPSSCALKTNAPMQRFVSMSDRVKSYRDFYENHNIYVRIEPGTGAAVVNVRDKS